MSHADPVVYVVDDDLHARESVCALVQSMGVNSVGYQSAEAFLADYDPEQSGCVVTDLRMKGMSGVELQKQLIHLECTLPVILMTAYAKTPVTVEVIKKGAVTVLEKPYDDDDLWTAIRNALQQERETRNESIRRRELRDRLTRLTPSEREVLDRIVDGKANKKIAAEIGVSLRTVENRRHEVFEKMGANSVADLVKVVLEAKSCVPSNRP